MSALSRFAGQYAISRGVGAPARRWLARPFSRGARRRGVIYYHPSEIAFAQIYPFLHFEADIAARFEMELRLVPVEELRAGHVRFSGADAAFLSCWFNEQEEDVAAMAGCLRDASPNARIGFIDTFAHNDIRLASVLDGAVDGYYKKALFRDRRAFLEPLKVGDTTVADYYARLYDAEAKPPTWRTPESFLDKLNLSPGFFTGRQLLPAFLGAPPRHRDADRPIDIHARFAAKGMGWYKAMRLAAQEAVKLPDLSVATGTGLARKAFLAELGRAKLCFSPHGYGELCWRDVEAMLMGAVVLKPEMSTLETDPDLFEPGVTYLPVAWDFSDVEEVARLALADPERRAEITQTAFTRIAEYLRSDRFARSLDPIFS
ncbi:MAG: glycosyltransferase [Pseudomonadota bacterium]